MLLFIEFMTSRCIQRPMFLYVKVLRESPRAVYSCYLENSCNDNILTENFQLLLIRLLLFCDCFKQKYIPEYNHRLRHKRLHYSIDIELIAELTTVFQYEFFLICSKHTVLKAKENSILHPPLIWNPKICSLGIGILTFFHTSAQSTC